MRIILAVVMLLVTASGMHQPVQMSDKCEEIQHMDLMDMDYEDYEECDKD